jgi:hypothetical protein
MLGDAEMPEIADLINEISDILPIYAYPTKQLVKTLGDRRIRETTRFEIVFVRDFGYAGGLMCDIKLPDNQVLVVSSTNLRFLDDAPIYDKINKYKNDRKEWLKTVKPL